MYFIGAIHRIILAGSFLEPYEAITQRTPGKWFSKSKVVNTSNKKPAFGAIVIRSLARITLIDLFFSPFLGMPLHDYISKTRVVAV
jgi:uncharacterized RDD family membrane protein YckC